MKTAYYGDWVEIENVVLPAGERAPGIPSDTQVTDLKEWLKGTLLTEKAIKGDMITIETVIGRRVNGKLSDIRPRFIHNFGEHIHELIEVRKELRKEMEGI